MRNQTQRGTSGRRLITRTLTGLLVVAFTLALSGGAFAYFSGNGTGARSSSAATTVAVTITAGTPTAGLYPGGQSNVSLTVANSNAFDVSIASLALDTTQGTGGFAVDAAHTGCGLSALSFTTQTNGGAGWTVPKKVGAVNGTLTVNLNAALAMSVTAANACQGAAITVYLTAA